METKRDHVVLCTKTGKCKCKHCGESFDLQLPQSVNMISVVTKEFLKIHRSCISRDLFEGKMEE